MEIKGIVFDLDGVICSTDEYHYLAWKKLSDEEGIEFDRSGNERLRGISRAESLEIILERSSKKYSNDEKLEMMERKNGYYREYLANMNRYDVSDEVRDTLNTLRKKGIPIAIGSSSMNTMFILERIGLADFFDAVSDGTIITRSKPNPEVFIKAAGMLRLRNENCLVVEDAPAGIDAANAGGFISAGIGAASHYEKTMFKIGRFNEILSLVTEIPDKNSAQQ